MALWPPQKPHEYAPAQQIYNQAKEMAKCKKHGKLATFKQVDEIKDAKVLRNTKTEDAA